MIPLFTTILWLKGEKATAILGANTVWKQTNELYY